MIRATLVLLALCLVVPRLRRRSAAERHLLWAAGLGMAAALPPLGVWLPAWRPEWASRLAERLPASLGAFPGWGSGGGAEIVVRATGIDASSGWTLSGWLLTLWAVGASIATAFLLIQALKLSRLLTTTEPADEAGRRVAADVARALGLRHPPLLLRSTQAAVPMTWGVRRPRVLLPASSAGWPEDRLRAVLAHELGHVRRRDWMTHLAAQSLCALYWFHPLFWIVERRIGREAEQAADDLALATGLDSAGYAGHLLAVVRASRQWVRAPAVAMARPSHLEERVRALLRADANRAPLGRRRMAATATLAALITLPLAAMTNHAGSLDVEIRTLNLPRMLSPDVGRNPLPALPAVRIADAGRPSDTATLRAPIIAEYTTPPLYSDEARRRGVEGTVTIAVRIESDGGVTRARVLNGLGFGLDQNALVAVRQWRFRPGIRSGTAVAMDVEVDVEFNLRTEAVNAMIANDMATLVGPGVTAPRIVFAPSATLPRLHATGTVLLDVVLQEDGTPRIVRILRSLTPEADEIAVRHFEQWRFTPAVKDGRPVKVRMNAELAFHG